MNKALFLVLAIVGWVQATEAQFSYVTNDGAITMTGYTGSGAMTIPGTTNGYPVVNIADGAFSSDGITNATIPNTVTNIGAEAFYGCAGLAAVSLGSGVNTVGSGAFEFCSALAGITLPTRLADIDSDAFGNCSNLITLVIPNSVTNMGSGAFENCMSLTNVTIGTGVTNIPSYTFYGSSLSGIDIPTNVTSIGLYVFAQCYKLTAITVDPGNPAFSSVNGVLLDKNQTTLLQYPEGKTAKGYTIPNTVTNVETTAFIFCTNLVSVVIPASVGGIGDYAFELCGSALTGVYFLGSPPGFGVNVFTDDPNLIIYYLPGATGWSSPFGGVTAELWNPKASKFSVTAGHFGFEINGPTNAVILVAACTNLANPVWLPVSTNTLTSGASSFSDVQSPNYPERFYRFRSP